MSSKKNDRVSSEDAAAFPPPDKAALLELVQRAGRVGLWRLDLASGERYLSQEWRRIMGLAPEVEAPPLEAFLEQVHPEDRPQVEDHLEAAPGNGATDFALEFRVDHPERGERWILSRGQRRPSPHGEGALLQGIVIDITEQKHTEEALRRREEYLECILESARDYAIFTIDPEGRVAEWNQGAARLLGYEAEEIVGRKIDLFFTSEDRADGVPAKEMELATEKGRADDERWHVRKDGSRFWANGLVFPLHNGQGFLKILRDQTEQKEAEEALRRSKAGFEALANNIPELIWMADEDGWMFWYNQRWYDYTGTTLEDVQGRGWKQVHHPDHVDRVAKKLNEHIERGEPWEDTFPIRNRDGEYRWFLARAIPIRNAKDEIVRWLGTNTDVTELRETREALRELNATLEERVRERTKQVRHLTSKLTRAEQEERRRISQILHDDLQQRLYSIQMKMLMLRNNAEAGAEALLEDIDAMEAWLGKSIEITRQLTVDLSPPVLKSEGLADALSWLVTQMEEMHDLKIELNAEHSFHVSDQDMHVLLFQIVRELLFNVVKHADTEQAVVELEEADDQLLIHVVDHGRGFDVDAAAAQHENGFGLFSARERLRLFGGDLEVTSRPGEGTHVTVYAPADPD